MNHLENENKINRQLPATMILCMHHQLLIRILQTNHISNLWIFVEITLNNDDTKWYSTNGKTGLYNFINIQYNMIQPDQKNAYTHIHNLKIKTKHVNLNTIMTVNHLLCIFLSIVNQKLLSMSTYICTYYKSHYLRRNIDSIIFVIYIISHWDNKFTHLLQKC
jgi:hypothetical protein